MLCLVDICERPAFFLLERKRSICRREGREGGWGGVEEGQTVVEMYCMRGEEKV